MSRIHEILKLRAENDRLRAELAAIRDAGDDEIDDLARGAGNGIGSDYYQDKNGCHEAEECLNNLKDIAKARGLKIAEQAAENDRLNATVKRLVNTQAE